MHCWRRDIQWRIRNWTAKHPDVEFVKCSENLNFLIKDIFTTYILRPVFVFSSDLILWSVYTVCWPAASIPQIVCSRVCRDKTSSFFTTEDLDDNDFHDHFDLDLGFGADDENGLAWTIYMGQTVCPTYQPICCWAALSTSITCALVIISSPYYCYCYHYIVLIIFFILILLRYKGGQPEVK